MAALGLEELERDDEHAGPERLAAEGCASSGSVRRGGPHKEEPVGKQVKH